MSLTVSISPEENVTVVITYASGTIRNEGIKIKNITHLLSSLYIEAAEKKEEITSILIHILI